MDYEFHVGDYVETVDGETGYIIGICDCSSCKDRGFNEPIWRKSNSNDTDYITCYEYLNGFKGYKRIGKYNFTEKSKKITKLTSPFVTAVIDGKENSVCSIKTYGVQINFNVKEFTDKINELIDAVNELREK